MCPLRTHNAPGDFRRRRNERAPTISREQWERMKPAIRKYYIEKGKRFEEVCDLMEKNHSFRATEQQYRNKLREWQMFKNQKRALAENPGQGSSFKRTCTATLGAVPSQSLPFHSSDGEPVMEEGGYFPPQATAYSQREYPPNSLPIASPADLPMDIPDLNFGDFYNLTLNAQPLTAMNIVHGGGHTAQPLLCNNVVDLSAATSKGMRQPIHDAAHFGWMPNIEKLLDVEPGCADLPDENGATPLLLAAYKGHTRLVKLLVDKYNVAVNVSTANGRRTPIHQAALKGHTEIVRTLLDKGAEPDTTDDSNISPLWLAAHNGSFDIVKLLLDKNADANMPSENDCLPIHRAAQDGHTEIVRLLLEHGGKAGCVDENNVSPLWIAAQNGHTEIVKELLERRVDTEVTSIAGRRRPLHQAAQNGHLEATRLLLDHNAKTNPETDSFGAETPSPLWLATQKGSVGIAELLIERGADVDYTFHPSMQRPLHQAAQNGHLEVTRLLIREKAEVNLVEKGGWTSLMMAAHKGHVSIVNELLQAGANVNLKADGDVTALLLAAQEGHLEIVRILLGNGALAHATKTLKRHPIHQAAQNAHIEVVKLLVGREPDCVNLKDKNGSTPLGLAASGKGTRRELIMEYLLANGALAVVCN